MGDDTWFAKIASGGLLKDVAGPYLDSIPKIDTMLFKIDQSLALIPLKFHNLAPLGIVSVVEN